MIPVIFLRKFTSTSGHFAGLPIALKCAQRWNDGVILIGDEKQPEAVKNSVEFHEMEQYSNSANAFRILWNNVHGSHPDAWFLRVSLEMWLVLADWMEDNDEDFVCCFDTDVLCFDRIEDIYQHWTEFDISACNAEGTMQAPTFVSLHAMQHFKNYLFDLFTKQSLTPAETDEREQCKCCMSAWRLAAHNRGLTIGNLCDVVNGTTFSHNAGMQYGNFAWDGKAQVFEFMNGQPYSSRNVDGKVGWVRFVNVHCWADLKQKMGEIYQRSLDSMT